MVSIVRRLATLRARLLPRSWRRPSRPPSAKSLARVTSMSGGYVAGGWGTIESYQYLGLRSVIQKLRPEASGVGGTLRYFKKSGDASSTSADQYTGLDLFGRVADQRWVDGSTGDGSDVDRLKYGHDRNSNPLYKQNLLASGHSEVFTYDGLDRMQTFKRGSIAFTGGAGSLATVATPSRSQRTERGKQVIAPHPDVAASPVLPPLCVSRS
jgi:hypothetical protein